MAAVQDYVYRASDATGGKLVKGTIEAASEAAVATKLRAQGLIPLQISPVSKTGLNQEIKIPGFEKRVKVASLAVFSKQMAGLVDAGLPLLRVLTILSEQTEDKVLQPALVTVQGEVARGASLSAAMSAHPEIFPPLMISMIKVGETGGFLADAMKSIARTYASEADLQNKIKSATTYPIVVLVIAILGVIAMVTFVVPVFKGMFEGLGSALPIPTQIIVTISENMVWMLPLMIVLFAVFWAWWSRNKNTEKVRRVVDPFKLRMPVFGTLATKIAVARFARSLSMMLNAGVPLIQALSIVGEASNNYAIEQAIKQVQESVRQGRTFAAPLAKAEVFPTMVAQMVSVGEESGSLPEMLASIADFYEGEVETATSQLTATIEPVLIVGIGIIIGGMVISLYLPIFTIYGELGAA